MTRPTRLYKYESFNAQALENLKNHSLYFSSPSHFNDPYDCAVFPSVKEPTDDDVERIRNYFLQNSETSEQAKLQFKKLTTSGLRVVLLRQGQNVLDKAVAEFISTNGVSCFSERNDSLLMWGHYGGRFKGFCLEFKTDQEPLIKARQVKYFKEMPKVDLVSLLCNEEDSEKVLDDLWCTKAFDWRYEKEWRCIHKNSGTIYNYTAEALSGLYIGPDASFSSLEILSLIVMNQNPQVKIWQGQRSKSDFSVVFQEVTYTPHLEAKRRGLLQDNA